MIRASRSLAVGFAGESSFARFNSARPSTNFQSTKQRAKPRAARASSQSRRDRNGLLGIASRFWIDGRALAGEIANKNPRFGTFCVSQSITGVEPDRFIEVIHSFAIVLEVPTLKMEMTLEISIVRFHVL